MEYSPGALRVLSAVPPLLIPPVKPPKYQQEVGVLLSKTLHGPRAKKKRLCLTSLAVIKRVLAGQPPDVDVREITDPNHHVKRFKPPGSSARGVFSRWDCP